MKNIYLIFCVIILQLHNGYSQVVTKVYPNKVASSGIYHKHQAAALEHIVNPPNGFEELKQHPEKDSGEYAFRVALPADVSIDVLRDAKVISVNDTLYYRYKIKAQNAYCLSMQFGDFYLSKNAEMYIYNESDNAVTGPIKADQNNKNNFWATRIYDGDRKIRD